MEELFSITAYQFPDEKINFAGMFVEPHSGNLEQFDILD